jgi:hypothetical protein
MADRVRRLRTHWRTASLAAGWPFPSDWALPEVDMVCSAVVEDADLAPALAELGRARAEAGAGLSETLTDLAALHAVLETPDSTAGMVGADPDALPARHLRVLAIAWAELAVHRSTNTEVADGLTGLSTAAYLRTRLREVYAECALHGVAPESEYVLVGIGIDLAALAGWSRLAAVVLLADVLQAVFDGGETLTALGPSVAVALCRRDERLAMRVASVRWLAVDRFALDAHLDELGEPRVWLERLPAGHEGACALLAHLGRS